MHTPKHTALILAQAGMELCWLHAWGAFVLFAAWRYLLPFPMVLAAFATGSAVAVALGPFARRRIWTLCLQLLAFGIFCGLLVPEGLTRASTPAAAPPMPPQWFFLAVLTALLAAAYIRGLQNPGRPLTATTVYARFDLGLGAFFILFIIKIIFESNGATAPDYPILAYLFGPYFILGLLAIGLLRNRGPRTKDAVGIYKLGVLLLFLVAVPAMGAGILVLCHGQLANGAQLVSGALQNSGARLVPALVSAIRVLMMHRGFDCDSAGSAPKQDLPEIIPAGPMTDEVSAVEQAVVYGIAGLGVVVFGLLGFSLLHKLFQFLALQNNGPRKADREFFNPAAWLQLIFRQWRTRISRWVKGCRTGWALYTALAAWGRRSGVARRATETPREYGRRLAACFPVLEKEIEAIVELANREVFGEIVLSGGDLRRGRQARRAMSRPRHWSTRLKNWLRPPGQS